MTLKFFQKFAEALILLNFLENRKKVLFCKFLPAVRRFRKCGDKTFDLAMGPEGS